MEAVAAIGAWAFGNSSFSNGLQTFFSSYSNSPSTTVMNELAPLLSDKSLISFPGSPEFLEATTWWQEYNKANVTIVVEPTTEADVQAIIKYANLHGVQFLARTGGHGAINSLAAVDQGIEIWMRRMNSVAIAPDGQTATFGGGVMSMEVTNSLWEAKKQTVTGVCECTSMVGPMLGGGHGVLQGRYGLISDNLISTRVVLANGSAVTASSTENSDLFWALQGAGHNFGIITEFTSKIYDVPDNSDWAHETYIYTHDKAEAVFDQINKQTDDGVNPVPVELLSWAYFLHLPHIDPVKPVIIFTNLYEGAEKVPDQYTKPFHAIGPVFTQPGVASYLEVPAITGNGKDQAGCTHGDSILRFPFQTKTYNVEAQRKVLDAFAALTAEYPAFNRSVFLLEGYPLHGVKAIKDETTAFPHRGDNLILCPVAIYAPNATLDPIAIEFGQRVRRIWHEASGSEEMHAYVNYAHGDETLEELYGYEPWRIEKLKGLKKKYDPEGSFGFYAPIS